MLYSLIFSFHLLVTGACFNFSQNCFMNNFRVIDNLPVATKFVLETGQVRTMIAKNFNVILFYPNNTLFRTILKCLFFHLNNYSVCVAVIEHNQNLHCTSMFGFVHDFVSFSLIRCSMIMDLNLDLPERRLVTGK